MTTPTGIARAVKTMLEARNVEWPDRDPWMDMLFACALRYAEDSAMRDHDEQTPAFVVTYMQRWTRCTTPEQRLAAMSLLRVSDNPSVDVRYYLGRCCGD